jgi:aldehyde:ferredoxin oxidoreductase
MAEGRREAGRPLAAYEYEVPRVDRGYTGQTLYIDLSTGEIDSRPVTDLMKEKFIGGRGFGLWLLWNAVHDTTKWDDAENEIIISTGPIGGTTQYAGSGKSLVVSLSPLTDIVIDSNVGGHFGPLLKFSGWDALEIQGKADADVYVAIDGVSGRVEVVQVEGAPKDTHLLGDWLMDQVADTARDRHSMSTVTAGQGAEHTRLGCLNFSLYDRKRKGLRYKQAGRGGIGTVFRDKGLLGLIVRSGPVRADSNAPADPRRIARVGAGIHREIADYDDEQNQMRRGGTSYLVQVMDDYDLLPVHNFRYGSHPETSNINGDVWRSRFTQGLPDGCWYGCTLACSHAVDGYTVRTGPYKGQKVIVDGPEYETIAGVGSNCGIFDPDAILELNFYCDTYGVDTISFGTLTAFVMECYEEGILDERRTGGLKLNWGNAEASIALLHQMAKGEGFGEIAGQGIRRMKRYFAEEFGADETFLQDIGTEAKGLEYSEYLAKESLAQQGGYGLTNKGPQHDEAWLIFMDQVSNLLPTFEDKAEALHYFPMFRTWFGLVGLCKLPWNDIVPPDNALEAEPAKVPAHIRNYLDLFAGVTGRELTEPELIEMSEAVYNFQRVFNIRLGKGLREHDAIPYRVAGPVTVDEYTSRDERYDKQLRDRLGLDAEEMTVEEKLKALRSHREQQYQQLTDAVYRRRGWTADGVPTLETLQRLGIDFPDVVRVVKMHL